MAVDAPVEQCERDRGAGGVVGVEHAAKVEAQEIVAVDDQATPGQAVGDVRQGAGGAEQGDFTGVLHVQAKRATVADRLGDAVGGVVQVDPDVVDARRRKPAQVMNQDRPAAEWDQRLRQIPGNRPDPRSKPGREYECGCHSVSTT